MNVDMMIIFAGIIFVAALILSVLYRRSSRAGLSILLGGIILSSLFLFLPYYYAVSADTVFPVLRTIVFTLFYGLKSISGGQEIKALEAFVLDGTKEHLKSLYYILNYIYFALAPLLTSGLILSLFGDLMDRIRCWIRPGRKYHIFSELNERSLHLAKQVKAEHPLELIVFCSTKDSNKELVLRAKNLGAATVYADCDIARFPLLGKRLQYYLISPNEDINLCCAEALLHRYKDRENASAVINAFAESGTGIRMVEELVEHAKNKGVSVRFIDATALLCNNLLLQHPLYQLPDDCKTISVMIVGCDKTGMGMLKAVTWCGQVDGYRLKIRIYDKNAALQEKKFRAQCPELMDNCDIRFVSVDARTADFENAVLSAEDGSSDATYAVMATGDDELNIEVADRLFRLFRHKNRYGWTPKILVRIRNSAKSDIYSDGSNPYLTSRRIYPFGRMEDVFTRSTLFHSRLENLAFAVHLCYWGQLPSVESDLTRMSQQEVQDYLTSDKVRECRQDFLHSEYNRRSSMATALHIGAKLHRSGCPEETELSQKVALKFRKMLEEDRVPMDALAQNEHQRWNQFMRSEGFTQATWEDLLCFYPTVQNNQDELSKRHLCITGWEELDDLEKRYNDLNPPKKKHFKTSDYEIVRRIPDILLLAEWMEKKSLQKYL